MDAVIKTFITRMGGTTSIDTRLSHISVWQKESFLDSFSEPAHAEFAQIENPFLSHLHYFEMFQVVFFLFGSWFFFSWNCRDILWFVEICVHVLDFRFLCRTGNESFVSSSSRYQYALSIIKEGYGNLNILSNQIMVWKNDFSDKNFKWFKFFSWIALFPRTRTGHWEIWFLIPEISGLKIPVNLRTLLLTNMKKAKLENKSRE
jgi:hypothetical protein